VKCPACNHDIPTRVLFGAQGWRFNCPHCQARLEGRNPRLIGLLCFFLAVIVPGHLGHQFVLIADILMVAIFLLALREMMRPNLRLRKDHPKPENKLNIND